MRCLRWSCIIAVACSLVMQVIALGATGSDPVDATREARAAATVDGVAAATALSNIDSVVLRSTIRPNVLKGSFGEAHMERFLVQHLKQAGGWTPLPARIGPQGLDGVMIRCDATGQPTGLIVSEAKYGSAQLGQTADGIQMGKTWRENRLDKLGRTYRGIAESIRTNQIRIVGAGGSVGKDRLQLILPGSGKAAVFARAASNQPWEFVGPPRLLPEAADHLERVGPYLQRAARGEVPYESNLYKLRFRDGALHVTIKDATRLGPGVTEGKLPTRTAFKIPLTSRQIGTSVTVFRDRIAREFQARFPHLRANEADLHARQIVRNAGDIEKVVNATTPSVGRTVGLNALRIGGGAAVFDASVNILGQYLTTGTVRWREVAVSAAITTVSAAGGAAAGQATTALLTKSAVSQQLIARSSTVLGVGSSKLLAPMIGGSVGGGVTSILFALGGYMTGTYDSQTAARMGVSGVSSAAIGVAGGMGILAFATTFGTASTGTAIASLHGIVATNAALAWLGGGTLAAGGLGVAGGAVVISGGVAIVVIGSAWAINRAFSYWDEGNDLRRISLTIDRLAGKTDFGPWGGRVGTVSSMKIGKK